MDTLSLAKDDLIRPLSKDKCLNYIDADALDDVWDLLTPLFLNVLNRDDRYTIEWLYARLSARELHLFVFGNPFIEFILIAGIEDYPNYRMMRHCFASGENARRWIPYIADYIEPWAKNLGCEKMELIGRKGWLKWLPDYELQEIVMVKSLKENKDG